jgi:hypothetical protein
MRAEADPDRHMPSSIRRAALVGGLLALAVFAVLVAEGRPSGLVQRGPFSSDFFDAQAHALLDGHLDVDPSVAGIEGFVHDGRTQLYFGLVPALLRLPVAALTDRFDGRLGQLSMLVALAIAMAASTRLLWRARRHRRGDAPVGPWEPRIVAGFTAAVGLSSPLLFLGSRPVVYHETELWGAATTLVALEAILAWWDRPTGRGVALASLAVAVAFNTRASVGGGAVAALALVSALALLTHRRPRSWAAPLAVAVLLPVGLYAAVNMARFDSPFGVPFREQVLSSVDPARQATLASTGGTLFGPEFAPTAVVTYLRPDGISVQRLFPWVTFRESTPVIGDATFDTLDRSASLPTVTPALVLLGLVGLAASLRRGWRDPWLVTALGAATGLASTITIAFVANRYLADFTPALVLLAAVGTWVVASWLRAHPGWGRRAAVAALAALAGAGTLVSLALAVQSQRLFILPSTETRHDFVAFQYDVHDALGGGAPPGVQRAADIAATAPRGHVTVLDQCRGLYWSDGKRWWPLELGGTDGLVTTGPVGPGRSVLLDAAGWRLVAEGTADRLRLAYEADDGTTRRGPWVPRAAVDGEALTVWLDRVNNELTVTSGSREVLVAWLVDLTGSASTPPGRTVTAASTPLCDDLVHRLTR